MKFSEVIAQTLAWLQREGRVSYRALKREFELDDEFLEDLKAEIIEAKRLAIDENGKVLVWTGKGVNGETEKRGKGEDSLDPSVQRRESKDQPLAPSPQTLHVQRPSGGSLLSCFAIWWAPLRSRSNSILKNCAR